MTKLLIVDDSALMRRLLSDVFGAAGDFEIAVAKGGDEALSLLHSFQPQVITLDVHMPGMDGITCLDRIMVERPTPVVMISALTGNGANTTLEAMALGAVDFIAKPRGAPSIEIESMTATLIEKVRGAAQARISRTTRLVDRVRLRTEGLRPERKPAPEPADPPADRARNRKSIPVGAEGLVIIGTSTGGPAALDCVLGALPADFPWPVLVAQHMPASFTGALARRLDRLCELTVVEVSRPEPVRAGSVYIGRGDADFMVSRRAGVLTAMAVPSSPEMHWHPSVDRLVQSAMQHVAPECLVGVLMTGMGNDGASAMTELARVGGHTIAEAQSTAVIWGMPGALVAACGADQIVELGGIAAALIAYTIP